MSLIQRYNASNSESVRSLRVKQILTGTGHPSLSIFPFYIKGRLWYRSIFNFNMCEWEMKFIFVIIIDRKTALIQVVSERCVWIAVDGTTIADAEINDDVTNCDTVCGTIGWYISTPDSSRGVYQRRTSTDSKVVTILLLNCTLIIITNQNKSKIKS